jgi:hypothetical protein
VLPESVIYHHLIRGSEWLQQAESSALNRRRSSGCLCLIQAGAKELTEDMFGPHQTRRPLSGTLPSLGMPFCHDMRHGIIVHKYTSSVLMSTLCCMMLLTRQ